MLAPMNNMVQMNGQANGPNPHLLVILSNNRILREVFRLVYKFQSNFGLRSIMQTGEEEGKVLVDKYVKSIFDFSVSSLSVDLPNKT